MSFIVKMDYAPFGNLGNIFSAGVMEGGQDPGVPQADDGDNDLPPIESSEGGENINELSTNDGTDQVIGNSTEDDDSLSRSGGNDRRT